MQAGFATLACATLAAACALSTDAVVPERDAIFDQRLIGAWQDTSGGDRVIVSRAGAKGYAIEYTDGAGKVARLEGRLGEVGKRMVLDLWATPRETDVVDPYRSLLIPGHLLVALDVGNGEIRTASLDPDSLIPRLHTGEMPLSYVLDHGRVILNGTTAQLRGSLGTYMQRPGGLVETGTWRRTGSGAASAAPDALASTTARADKDPCFEASAWREADLLFQRDAHWVGGDGAFSVDLGNDRTLWLFGDSFIDASGSHTREGSRMVRNTVAIQTGKDPSRAKMAFYWGRTADGRPDSFFPADGSHWFWPTDGIRFGDRLVLFLGRLSGTREGLGFTGAGWRAVMVENPDDEPPRWRVRALKTRENLLGVGASSPVRLGGRIYAFGAQDQVHSSPLHVMRWAEEDVRKGNLLEPEWWAGPRVGWVADSSVAPRWPVLENGLGVSIHYDTVTRRFIQVQTSAFGAADVTIRSASDLTGPWSAQRMIYRPSEFYQPDIMIYQAIAHPELSGADLVLTYSTNSFRLFEDHMRGSLIYYPRFVRLARCRQPSDR
jgi:hypothetical protein